MRRDAQKDQLSAVLTGMVGLIEIERIRTDIERLCKAPRHSGTDSESHKRAAEYVAEQLGAAGCEVERQEFTIPAEPDPRPGLNVVATLPKSRSSGDSPAVAKPSVLVGAHYDTVPGSPGADDNASGVAVMLECSRVLAKIDRNRPVIFAAFDAEERQPEVGLHGSEAYVRSLKASDSGPTVSEAYILEMVGYSAPEGAQQVPQGLQLVFPRAFDQLAAAQFAGDSVVVVSDWRSRRISRALEEASRSIGGTPILPVEVPRWMPVPHNLKRSDHAPFWEAKVPAVMIGDTANFRNPNYHTPTDTPDTLDYSFIESVARTVIATVARAAVTTTPVRKPRVRLR